MSRVPALVAALAAVTLTSLPAIAGDAYTTRIEPRGFYGATISIEEGVRVFRPLPPVRHVIVNPNGATPLNLSISDVRVHEHRVNTNYNYDARGGASGGSSYGGIWGGLGGYGHKAHGKQGSGKPGGFAPGGGGHHHGGGKGHGGKH